MDHKPSNPETDSWVDDRMAKLDPSAEWNPDAGRAFERLSERKPAFNAPWMRFAMTTTILAGTVVVLVLLPWQRFWTPKQAARVAAQTQATPSEKPAEQQKPAAATQQTVEKVATPQETEAAKLTHYQTGTPETSTPEQEKWSEKNLPDNETDLLKYLTEMAKTRTAAATPLVKSHLQTEEASAPQAGVTEPMLIRNVQPSYTEEAKRAKVQGTVEVVVTVKVDGTVQFESFKKTVGYGLDEKAREAVEQWQFVPAKKDGNPVATTITIAINFSLR